MLQAKTVQVRVVGRCCCSIPIACSNQQPGQNLCRPPFLAICLLQLRLLVFDAQRCNGENDTACISHRHPRQPSAHDLKIAPYLRGTPCLGPARAHFRSMYAHGREAPEVGGLFPAMRYTRFFILDTGKNSILFENISIL